ncbi:ricin-type beta-trefoil lectin domain protein [Streptomyces sp. NPDC001450]
MNNQSPRHRHRKVRVTTLLLACLALVIGMVVSAVSAPMAQALDDQALRDIELNAVYHTTQDNDWRNFSWNADNYTPGVPVRIRTDSNTSNQRWAFVPNSDGTFEIKPKYAGDNFCVTASDNYTPGGYVMTSGLFVSWCEGSDAQKWYAQPTSPNGSHIVIRHYVDDKCVDLDQGDASNGTSLKLYPCHPVDDSNSWAQAWNLYRDNSCSCSSVADYVDTLATQYALHQVSQYADNSTPDDKRVIKDSSYSVTNETPAFLGKYQKLTEYIYNDQDTVQTRTRTETQQTGWTNKVGVEAGFQYEVGYNAEIVAKITLSLKVHYDHEWYGSQTYTDSYTLNVPPHSTGWVVRAQLYKTVTGNWKLTTDRGWTFSGQGTATVSAKDNQTETGGMNSDVVYCSTKSVRKVCMDTRPTPANSMKSVANDTYARAALAGVGNDYGRVWTGSGTVGAWETFRFIWQSDGTVAIKSTANNKYVSAELGWTGSQYGHLRARADSVGPWEKFKLKQLDDGNAALYSAANGKYVWVDYADRWTLKATRGTIGTDKHAEFVIDTA